MIWPIAGTILLAAILVVTMALWNMWPNKWDDEE